MPTEVNSIMFESLESRRLLAGFQLNVNFQPEGADVPAGYVADVGDAFGRRASGHVFGWSNDNRANAIDRDDSFSPDQRFDTFNQMLPGESWSVEVPNGSYRVRLLVGDPTDEHGRYIADAEGVRMLNGLPRNNHPYIDRIATIDVTDGELTLTSGLGTNVNKLAYIEITQLNSVGLEQAEIDWTTTGAPAPNIRRIEAGTVQMGDKLYLIGGYNSGASTVTRAVEVLDLNSLQWSSRASIPEEAAESHAGFASDGERYIYWIAGQKGPQGGVGSNTAWRYDTVADTWDRYIDLPEKRFAGGLAYFNGVLYFFGGNDESRSNATTNHWALNTRSRNPSWIERAPLPEANDHHSAVVINGTIYSIGGETGHGTTYDQHDGLFAYNPWTNTWSTKADLPTASSHFEGGTFVIGNKILLVGGRIEIADGEFTDEVRLYDTESDTWTVLGDLPDARLGPSGAIHNGRVYIVNGYSSTHGLSDVAYWGTLHGV